MGPGDKKNLRNLSGFPCPCCLYVYSTYFGDTYLQCLRCIFVIFVNLLNVIFGRMLTDSRFRFQFGMFFPPRSKCWWYQPGIVCFTFDVWGKCSPFLLNPFRFAGVCACLCIQPHAATDFHPPDPTVPVCNLGARPRALKGFRSF